jgi:hypothetical protein
MVIALLLNPTQAIESPMFHPQMQSMAPHPNDLPDPRYATSPWRRFRRILWSMAAFAFAVTLAAEWILYSAMGELQVATAIATAAGVFLTIMMAAALMGLMFVSSGTGHDEAIDDLDGDDSR